MIVEEWNKFSKHVVSAGTVDTFKKRLDISMDQENMVSARCTGAALCRLTGPLQSLYFFIFHLLHLLP